MLIRLQSFAVALLASLCGTAAAGTFSYSPGTWSSFTGSVAGTPSLYSSDPSTYGTAPSITLLSSNASPNNTLGGSFSYTVTWTSAGNGDTPPNNVVVTFNRQGILTVSGTGTASLVGGGTTYLEMDSTNNFLSGGTSCITTPISYTLPLALQTNGTYLASGQVTSDQLATAFDTQGSTITSCQEFFSLSSMVGSS
jgi:hypothetical protein